MKSLLISALAATSALALSTPAQAAACDSGIVSIPAYVGCAGYFTGNILSNSPADTAIQTPALNGLGFIGTPDYATLMAGGSPSKVSSLGAGDLLSFPVAASLSGLTYIGIHWGGQGGGQTAIYKFNFLTPVSSIEVLASNPGGFSSAVLYATGNPPVPEPATWALMIGGFALVGTAMRRRKTAVSFA